VHLNFSISEENYIKTIFHLQEESGTVSTNALADKLQTKPASITDMMKKLNAKKILHYKPYYGFYLSTGGKRIALSIIRRHRLWEFFLAEKLKLGWDEIHSIAEELEHVSSKLINWMNTWASPRLTRTVILYRIAAAKWYTSNSGTWYHYR
jgi:DtxR family Mn-dependent transcriptional regulator